MQKVIYIIPCVFSFFLFPFIPFSIYSFFHLFILFYFWIFFIVVVSPVFSTIFLFSMLLWFSFRSTFLHTHSHYSYSLHTHTPFYYYSRDRVCPYGWVHSHPTVRIRGIRYVRLDSVCFRELQVAYLNFKLIVCNTAFAVSIKHCCTRPIVFPVIKTVLWKKPSVSRLPSCRTPPPPFPALTYTSSDHPSSHLLILSYRPLFSSSHYLILSSHPLILSSLVYSSSLLILFFSLTFSSLRLLLSP